MVDQTRMPPFFCRPSSPLGRAIGAAVIDQEYVASMPFDLAEDTGEVGDLVVDGDSDEQIHYDSLQKIAATTMRPSTITSYAAYAAEVQSGG